MSDIPHDDSSPHSEVKTKRCPKCGETKPIDAFSKDNSKSDGLRSGCRACARVHKVADYAENRDKHRAKNAANYATNREKRLAYQAAYYAEHRDDIRVSHAAYRAANRDKRRAINAAYYAAHSHELRGYQHVYKRANPHTYRAHNAQRRARIEGNGGAGFSPAEYRAMCIAQAGICAYCKIYYSDPLQIDHVIPIRRGGPHEAANIVLACRFCNNEKRARTPEQWTDRWYYYVNLGRMM